MSDEAELQDVPLETPDTEDPPSAPGQQVVVQTKSQQDDHEQQEDVVTIGTSPVVSKDGEATASEESTGSKDEGQRNASEVISKDGVAAVTPAVKRSSVVEQVMNHSPGDGLKQLAYLEILMADSANNVTDRDVVDSVLNVVSNLLSCNQ